jgi:transposase
MKIVTLGLDLGKNLCSLAGLDQMGVVVLRRRLRREALLRFTARLEVCTVALEACCGAHHLGRRIAEQGHRVRLMSPEYVRPYVKAQKNDERDAEAIAEAATRPTMRFVELKSEAQLEVQSLHRVRGRLVTERTALINQVRALLLERGITAPQGRRKLERLLPEILAEEGNGLGSRMRRLIEDMRSEWRDLDERISAFNDELAVRARADDAAHRLTTIPGVGVLTATALVAAVGNARTFSCGRDLAAWVGTAPGNDGRQAEVARHQQAGQPLPTDATDPRCAHGSAEPRPEQHAPRPLAQGPARAHPPQRGNRSPGQQARPDRMGGPRPRPPICRPPHTG